MEETDIAEGGGGSHTTVLCHLLNMPVLWLHMDLPLQWCSVQTHAQHTACLHQKNWKN